jgi:hypothetical protein
MMGRRSGNWVFEEGFAMTVPSSEKRWEEYPESKLELIDGRLVAGNNLRGSRYLLWDILEGWGVEAALPMAAAALWWQALHQGFARFQPPTATKPAATWQAWAAQVSYAPQVEPAGPRSDWKHYDAANRLRMGLFKATHEDGFGLSIGRDCAMRLGENVFTPDVFLVTRDHLDRVTDAYLDGPADLVIEVLLPGHEDQDREVKRRYYAEGGVPEYWIIDPADNAAEFLRLEDGAYHRQPIAPDGRYRPSGVPGLALVPARLWEGDHWSASEPDVFELETTYPRQRVSFAESEFGWGALPFAPRPGLEPTPLSFEQFIAWCGEAKFELIRGRPLIGGTRGTQHVLGMLLRTFGLAEAVALQHPARWADGLVKAEEARRADPARRAEWWATARKAAAMLRNRFGVGRLSVIGDLARDEPLNVWSDITLVAHDLAKIDYEAHRALYELSREPDIDIELIRAKGATAAQQEEIERSAVEV